MTAKKSPAARKTSRSTRTKAELEEQIEELENRLESAPQVSHQAEALTKDYVKEVRQAVKGISVDAIVAAGAQFGLEAQRTVTGLTEQIAAKATELKTIQDAIAIEDAELSRLYDLDVAAASVKALLEGHTEKKAELEKEQLLLRSVWEEEVVAHNKLIAVRSQETTQLRQREQDDYSYKVRQERQRANDEFAQTMLLQNREQSDCVMAVNKDIASRLETLTAQEAQHAEALARIENLDTEISAKTSQAVAIATNSLKKDLLNTFALEKKDLELELRVSNEKNLSTNSANEKLAQQVIQLGIQLEAARDQVRIISEKALESASGQVALNAVRETVKEGNNGGTGRKS